MVQKQQQVKRRKKKIARQRLANFLGSARYGQLVQDGKNLSESRILEELENYESEEEEPIIRSQKPHNWSLTNVCIHRAHPPSLRLF